MTPQIRALLQMPYSIEQCVLLEMPNFEYIYTQIWAHIHAIENSRQMSLSVAVPYSECPTPSGSMFCSRWCPTWNSI